MNNLIDITDLTDTQLDNLLGGVDAEQVAQSLNDAGIDATVEWSVSYKGIGKVNAGGLVVVVNRGRAMVCKNSAFKFGHGKERLGGGAIVNAHVAAVEAVLRSV